jgi:hypothetical protein
VQVGTHINAGEIKEYKHITHCCSAILQSIAFWIILIFRKPEFPEIMGIRGELCRSLRGELLSKIEFEMIP